MTELEPALSPYCDCCCDICWIAVNDRGVDLCLLTSRAAGQDDGRFFGGLIGQISGDTVESQVSTIETVESGGQLRLLPDTQADPSEAPPERGTCRCWSSVNSKRGDCSRRRFFGGALQGLRLSRLCELERRGGRKLLKR